MKFIIAIDIGVTTFNAGIFSESLNEITISNKDKIRYYDGRKEVVHSIINQVNTLIKKNNIITSLEVPFFGRGRLSNNISQLPYKNYFC